jgi:hypothetical protein
LWQLSVIANSPASGRFLVKPGGAEQPKDLALKTTVKFFVGSHACMTNTAVAAGKTLRDASIISHKETESKPAVGLATQYRTTSG